MKAESRAVELDGVRHARGRVFEITEPTRSPERDPPGGSTVPDLCRSRGDTSARLGVWGVWTAMLVAATVSVSLHVRNIPFAEDWFLVPPITGNEPSLVAWAFTRNSEHLVAVPKAVYLSLLYLSGGDFRVGPFFNVAVLGMAAAAMLFAVSRVRGGRTRLSDAFFPIALLHLGHWDNLIWGWQIQFVLSTAITCALLAMVVMWRAGPPTVSAAAIAGVCVLGLSMSGGNGTVLAAPMALWLLLCSVRARVDRSPAEGLRRGALIVTGVATLAVVAGYLAGYQRPDVYPAAGLVTTATTILKFMAFGFGPAARGYWIPTALAAAGTAAVAGFVLADRIRRPGEDAVRLAGVVLFVSGLAALAVAMGWGRAGKVEASGYMSPRYALLAVPMLCAAYIVVELYASRLLRATAQAILFFTVLIVLPLNTSAGLQRLNWFERGFQSFEVDFARATPVDELADRHHPFLMPWSRDALAERLQMLRTACLGPYRSGAGADTGCNGPDAGAGPDRR